METRRQNSYGNVSEGSVSGGLLGSAMGRPHQCERDSRGKRGRDELQKGMAEQFQQGQRLRRMYKDLVPAKYNRDNVSKFFFVSGFRVICRFTFDLVPL